LYLEFEVTVLSAQNLIIPEIAFKSFSNLFAKCRLVDMNGHSRHVSGLSQILPEARTSSISIETPGRQGPMSFQGATFAFKSAQLAQYRNGFFRIEIFFGDGLATNTGLGAVFVPIEYCCGSQKPSVMAFPVVKMKAATTVLSLAINDGKGLGEVLVKFHRIENDVAVSSGHDVKSKSVLRTVTKGIRKSFVDNVDHQERPSLTSMKSETEMKSVTVKSTLHECNVYNSYWFAECILVGNKDIMTGRIVCEKLTIHPSSEGLLLTDICFAVEDGNVVQDGALCHCNDNDDESPRKNKPANKSSTDAHTTAGQGHTHIRPSLPTVPSTRQAMAMHNDRELSLSLFENQRRNVYPPFDWSTDALTRANFSDRDFSVAFNSPDKDNISPPDEFEWVDEHWKIDKHHIKTDENGWFYGFTFGKIQSNYLQHISHQSSLNTHARRRKWVRKVKLKSDSDLASNVWTSSSVQKLFELQRAKSTTNSNQERKLTGAKLEQGENDVVDKSWRFAVHEQYPESVLLTCKERTSSTAPIAIAWNAIESTMVVSPSILCIRFSVQRFFNSTANDKEKVDVGLYRVAVVEVFVSNCLADSLQRLISERILFSPLRDEFRQVQEDCRDQFLNVRPVSLSVATIPDANVNGSFPQTQELSQGSELMSTLDDSLLQLQATIEEYELLQHDNKTFKEAHVDKDIVALYQRRCRVGLYTAALIALEIHDWHHFADGSANALITNDVDICHSTIHLENDILTAQNRLEFLLDVAEKRIRDAALCGWKYRGRGFELFVEVCTNDYFIEIVGLLAAFFEEQGQSTVKVLVCNVGGLYWN
jgi:hypothetical protein